MDQKSYLEEGFNPQDAKVANLRSILNEYGIAYPSNAKKTQLVEIFQEKVAPNAAKWLQEYKDRIGNLNDSGIVKVGSKNDSVEISVVSDSDEDESETSKLDTSKASIKVKSPRSEKSPFSEDNVFQTLSPTSRKRRIVSDTTKKSKKPKADSKDSKDSKASTPSSKKSPEPIKVTSPKEKATSPKETKITSPKATSRASPRVSSKTNTPRSVKIEKKKTIFSDEEEDAALTPKKVASPVAKSAKSSASKVSKPTPKSKSATPSKASLITPKPKKSDPERTFATEQEEEEDFDRIVARIQKEEANEYHPVIDLNLASQLGVTIRGITPQSIDTQLETPRQLRSSAQPTPRRTPRFTNSTAATPKPKLSPIDKQKSELSDDELEDEEEVKAELERAKETVEAPPSTSTAGGKRAFAVLSTFIAQALIIGTVVFGWWYREQVFLVGYCGQEINVPTFPNAENKYLQAFGDYLDLNFKPSCTPCPSHARCFPNLELGCYEDFVEFKPLSNIIFPNNKKCVSDTKKAEKLEIMIDVALDLLRTKNAAKQCGKSSLEDAGIKLEELHDLLLSMKAPYITVEEFEELWQRSIVELEKESDIITGSSNIPPQKLVTYPNNTEIALPYQGKVLRSTSLSHLSLKCQLKNSIVGSLAQYKYKLLIMLIIFSLIKYIQHRYNQYKLEMIKVDIIYKEVLNKLQHQYRISNQFANSKINPFIGSNQLRDLILGNENNLKKRVKVWNSVVYKVENNTNVSVKLIENHGEIMKVWQWITDVDHELL